MLKAGDGLDHVSEYIITADLCRKFYIGCSESTHPQCEVYVEIFGADGPIVAQEVTDFFDPLADRVLVYVEL